jgi:polysaccharide chain length determinant protein (PEP-CTERM system associated)
MAQNGEVSVGDAKRVFRKYWWIVPVSTVLLGALGFAATLVLPKKYTSSTSVLVEQPIVSAEYVRPVVTDDLNMRLSSMKAQVLSGSRLQPIIEKLNLYPEQRATTSMDDLVAELQRAIGVELLRPMPGSSGQPPGFFVSVTFDKPQLAQQICTEVTSMFMQQNAQRRMEQSQKTNQFMGKELQSAKENLDEQDAKLAQFKRQYLGVLPEEEQTNLSLLTGMNTQLDAATQSLNRAQQDKAFNETLLAQQEANWKSTLNGGPQNPDTMEQQLSGLQDQLTLLLLRYTPEHPDVLKLKSQIAELKHRMTGEPAPKASAETTQAKLHEPPQLQQLRARVKQDDVNIGEMTRRQSQIQEQIRSMQARVQASPMVEQQYKELTRNYQMAQQIYNELLKKESDSSIAMNLEHEQESEVFRVLDPPSYPYAPSSPKVLQLVLGGLGAGFALAIAIIYLLAILDKAMYTERDVELSLKLPVLTSVPSFDAMHGRDHHKKSDSKKYEPALALKV